jgi:hypothetical protein
MRTVNVYDRIDVGGCDSWTHIWACICAELGIEE